nr:MAG TPA: hypothetical protein [Caudoviricetes sp.]
MVINETKEEFTLKLVDYYNSILMSYRDSSDKESRDYVFRTLLRKNKEIIKDLLSTT